MSDSGERRRGKRLGAQQVFAALIVPGLQATDQGFGIVCDVSSSGIAVKTPQPPPLPSRVVVRVSVEEEVYEVEMSVRRIEEIEPGLHKVGLEFAPRDRGRLDFLRAFLASEPSTKP